MQQSIVALGLLASLTTPLLVEERSPARSSVQWLDVDEDGRRDALILSGDGALHLLLGDEQGNLVAADAGWGLTGLRDVLGVVPSGEGELLVLHATQGPRLLRREASAFVDVTLGSGLEGLGLLSHAAFVDYDGDGRLDLETRDVAGGLWLFHSEGNGRYHGQELAVVAAPLGLGSMSSSAGSEPVGGAASRTTIDSGRGRETRAPRAAEGAVSGLAGRTPVSPTAPASQIPGSNAGVTVIEELAAGGGCAQSLRDQSSGACVPASSTPTPGHLLPLGNHFFVDPSGNVGLGTQSPSADLHVVGRAGTVRLTSISPTTQYTQVQMATKNDFEEGMILRSEEEKGFGMYAFQDDRFGNPTLYGPHLVVEQNSGAQVGIGVADPESVLHVGGRTRIDAAGKVPGLIMMNDAAQQTVDLYAEGPNGEGGVLTLRQGDGGTTFSVDAEHYAGSQVSMYDADGTRTIQMRSEELLGNGAMLALRNGSGVETIKLDAHIGSSSKLSMDMSNGQETVAIVPEEFAGDGAQMELRRADGTTTITLDADFFGQGRIITDALSITGGSDLVEGFDVHETEDAPCEPGSVVVIDPTRTGELTLSSKPYDRCVAGVVSGAGGVRAGLHLGQRGVLDGDTPVALTGRVYVRCTTENGRVRPGDLLTTSSTAGAAMRASDDERSNGAVIGKAMGSLDEGTGLVLVLVNLQ